MWGRYDWGVNWIIKPTRPKEDLRGIVLQHVVRTFNVELANESKLTLATYYTNPDQLKIIRRYSTDDHTIDYWEVWGVSPSGKFLTPCRARINHAFFR